jgi:hypothetical protein
MPHELESRPEPAAAPQPAALKPLPAAPHRGSPAGLLALQRTAGNRAVGSVLARQGSAAPPTPAPAPVPTPVSNKITDAPTYGWTSAYDVTFAGDECKVNVKVKVVAGAGVSAADVTSVQNQTRTEFLRIWDRRFIFTDATSKQQYVLRVDLQYVASGQHQTITLNSGEGHDNLSTWYVKGDSLTRAHEMGHALGIKDEYVSKKATARATATSPGVFKDHSIMGNYYDEGFGLAEAKTRHATVMAGHIGAATGRTLTATRPQADVTVVKTEDWTGADEVYVRVTGPGGVSKTGVKSLNDGQSYSFGLSLVPFGDRTKPVVIDVFDEDWPDADDHIVSMRWSPPFAPFTNKNSYDGAKYNVTLRFA